MSLSLLRFFTRKKETLPADSKAEFSIQFSRFRLFLSAYLEAYSEVMGFEERANSEDPIGTPYLRMSTARLSIATMQCIMQLNGLSGGTSQKLEKAFDDIRKHILEICSRGVTPLDGPLVVANNALNATHAPIVARNLINLSAVAVQHPEFIAPGFVVTGAAWWSYYNDPELHEEIDRIICISQEDPGSYSEASASIRERLLEHFPLSDEITAAVKEAIEPLRSYMSEPGNVFIVRCQPVLPDHGGLIIPEQVISTPCDEAIFMSTLRSAFAQAYRPRAMIYRMKLGIRDRAMPFCVSFAMLPEQHARGSAHSTLNRTDKELVIHVRRGFSGNDSSPTSPAGLSEALQASLETKCVSSLASLGDGSGPDKRFEIFWGIGEEGCCSILGAIELTEPDHRVLETQGGKDSHGCDMEQIYTGGSSAYPGVVHGRACLVRNFEDALFFPIGSILMVPQAAPRWSFLLDFARGAIAGDGADNSMFARIVRRYGRPTIFGLPEAVEGLEKDLPICVSAQYEEPAAYGCQENVCDLPIMRPTTPSVAHNPHNVSIGRLWLHRSDIAQMVRDLAPCIMFLSLPEQDDPEYGIDKCTSIHDMLIYMYRQAVEEMMNFTTNRKTAFAPAKQLVCEVPKQFWVINLADGFSEEVNGPIVNLEQITSAPMLAFWNGFMDKPWDGPPQMSTKGFLSVFYEATMNPELEATSQVARYTEKNIFLIAERFCSLRCRFGFHFLALESLFSERERERFIIFQFKGGAANLARRIRRVHFVAELLGHFDFTTEIISDTLTARFEQGDEETFMAALRVIGYLFMHTRQLDMIMGDEGALAARRQEMLADMNELANRENKPGGSPSEPTDC